MGDEDGVARVWGLPLAIFAWTTASVLWAPRTVPDQPWASRILAPVVLPGFILCAAWVAAWLDRGARERGAGRATVALAAACFVVAMTVPTAVTTFGFSLSHRAAGHSGPAVTGLGVKRTGAGQTAAVQALCGAMSARMSVVFLDRLAASEFAPAIRGMCGVLAAVMAGASMAQVQSVIRGIAGTGREPVLLATRPAELTAYGLTPRHLIGLVTTQDAHDLTQPPSTHLAEQLPAVDVGAEHVGTWRVARRAAASPRVSLRACRPRLLSGGPPAVENIRSNSLRLHISIAHVF